MSGKILYVSNSGTQRCGVANYGRQLVAAAKQAGMSIVDWDARYPVYLPPNAADYEWIHFNWHGGTIGHIQEQHLPTGPRISLFLHEPPSRPDWAERAEVIITAEPGTGTVCFPPPCLDYKPQGDWDKLPIRAREVAVLIGHTGIRGEGLDRLTSVIETHNRWLLGEEGQESDEVPWVLSPSAKSADGWLSDEAEVERLALCTLNVCHYHAGYGGQATAPMMAVAARRPLLINSNKMLSHLFGASELYRIEDVGDGIREILRDIKDGRERRPVKLAEERAWGRHIGRLKEIWR